ncbi:MAG: hypothetical protein PF690_17475 [Deltaproteobacteria bacterium]|jgi:hypothetical protein|nr:hypothetical protein [Deltaproteobacteria bacterium]
MYVAKETGTERSLCIETVLEDITGGGVIEPDDFKSDTTELDEGALVGKDANGIYHLVKTAELYEDEANTETAYKALKGHEFVVGDVIMASVITGSAAIAITAIDTTNANYDAITVGTTLGLAMSDGDILAQATATAASGAGALKYTPAGISLNSVDLSKANQGCGIMVRGTVNQSLLAYPVDTTLKAHLPLIRFI